MATCVTSCAARCCLTEEQALAQAPAGFDRRIRVIVDDHGTVARPGTRPGAKHCAAAGGVSVGARERGGRGETRSVIDAVEHMTTWCILETGTRGDRGVGGIEDQFRVLAEVFHGLAARHRALQLLQVPDRVN